MASTIKTLYPSTSSVGLTITLASLASDTNLLAGREATFVDNTTNLDLDHLVSGKIKLGTSPTVSKSVEVWAFGSMKSASGTPTWPDVMAGADANKTITSANVKYGFVRQIATLTTDATTGLVLSFGPVSIASLFGAMPKAWGLFVVQNSGVALDSTGGNHFIEYERIQAQTV